MILKMNHNIKMNFKIKNNLINFYNNQNHKLQIYKIR